MNIHEHQAKEILRKYGVQVPNGVVVFSLEELNKKFEILKTSKVVLKAQIHAGGRGKAGGGGALCAQALAACCVILPRPPRRRAESGRSRCLLRTRCHKAPSLGTTTLTGWFVPSLPALWRRQGS